MNADKILMDSAKESYLPPFFEVMEFSVEEGFASSAGGTGQDGSWGSWDYDF